MRHIGLFAHAKAADARAVTVNRMADLLSVGLSAAWRLVSAGQVESFHIGRRCLVTVASIDALIVRRTAEDAQRRKPVRAAAASAPVAE